MAGGGATPLRWRLVPYHASTSSSVCRRRIVRIAPVLHRNIRQSGHGRSIVNASRRVAPRLRLCLRRRPSTELKSCPGVHWVHVPWSSHHLRARRQISRLPARAQLAGSITPDGDWMIQVNGFNTWRPKDVNTSRRYIARLHLRQ